MIKLATLNLLLILLANNLQSQCNSYKFSQLDSLQETATKKVVVFVYTDWCSYCEKMKAVTFSNDSVKNLLNNNYYFIKLNAEQKEDITIANITYKYKSTGINTGIHELAKIIGTQNGKLSYPSTIILNSNFNIMDQYNQYLNYTQLLNALNNIK
jgi:thioredoxin-related protein